MTTFFFFKFQLKKRVGFYKFSFCFFYFNLLPAFPPWLPVFPSDSHHPYPDSSHSHLDSHHSHPYSRIPTLIPTILTLISRIPTLIPRIPNLVLIIPTLIPRIPTLISYITIIPFIPFPDSPFQLLQIAFNCQIFDSMFDEFTEVK